MTHPILSQLFDALENERVLYCVLRDAERIPLVLDGEVDLLVAPDQWDRLAAVLARVGFAPLASRGYAPPFFCSLSRRQ